VGSASVSFRSSIRETNSRSGHFGHDPLVVSQRRSGRAPEIAAHRDDPWVGDPAALVEIAPAALVGQGEHEGARRRVDGQDRFRVGARRLDREQPRVPCGIPDRNPICRRRRARGDGDRCRPGDAEPRGGDGPHGRVARRRGQRQEQGRQRVPAGICWNVLSETDAAVAPLIRASMALTATSSRVRARRCRSRRVPFVIRCAVEPTHGQP